MSIENGSESDQVENFTVAKGQGEVVYNLMVGRRRPDRKAWVVTDLMAATKARRNTVYGWMRGVPPRKYLGPLAKVLGITADALLSLEGTPEEPGDISAISALYDTEGVPKGSYDHDATVRAQGLISRIQINPPLGASEAPDPTRTIAELVDTAERATEDTVPVRTRQNG